MRINAEFVTSLREQIDDIGQRYPALKPDQLFTVWFLRAYLTESEKAAVEAITGGVGDKGIDAVLIDDKSRAVFLVQTKYRLRSPGKSESRTDVLSFAGTAAVVLTDKAEEFKKFLRNADGATQELISVARKRIQQSGYKLRLYFVSLGTFSETLERDARNAIRGHAYDVAVELVGGRASDCSCAITWTAPRRPSRQSIWRWNADKGFGSTEFFSDTTRAMKSSPGCFLCAAARWRT